jgi:hypothetical protein
MEILDRKDHQRIPREPAKQAEERFVELAASPLRMQLRGGVRGSMPVHEPKFGGHSLQSVIDFARIRIARTTLPAVGKERSDGLDYRSERQGTLGQAHTTTLQDDRTPATCHLEGGCQDAGLADACLSTNQHGPSLSGPRLLDGL